MNTEFKKTAKIKQLEELVREQKKEIRGKDREIKANNSAWKHVTPKMIRNAKTPSAKKLLHIIEILEGILESTKDLHAFAGLTQDEFYNRLAQFEILLKKDPNVPLFHDEPSPDPGNRCKLYRLHALLLALHHDRGAITQEQLAATYGIDQSTVSRYIIRLSETMDILLPDPWSISEEIKECLTKEEFLKWVPGGILILDGSRTPHVRPMDPEMAEETYSGKVRAHTLNTLIAINRRKEIVWISKTHPGSVHDIVLADELADTFGYAIKQGWLTIVADSGFQGIEKRIAGLVARIMQRRKLGKAGEPAVELTEEEEARNKKISQVRIAVENVLAWIKNNGITRVKFRGTPEEFNRIFNIQAGKVNFHFAFGSIQNETGVIGRFMAQKDMHEARRQPG